jgi:glycosyltransferase involved in cell wall biosynthesis
MKVLHVIPSIAACYGGPSKVVIDTCRALRQAGIEAEIATTNADESADTPIPRELPAIVDDVPVYFFARQNRWRYKFSWPLTQWLERNVHEYDLLHLHALFSYSTAAAAHFARKQSIPYIVLPHGMLAPWAIQRNRFLKQYYLKLIEQKNLARAAAVQFTAEEELKASAFRGRANFVLPYVLDLTKQKNGHRREPSCRPRILFLSRLHPKKGLDLLIQAAGKLAGEGKDFELLLAGNGDREYEEVLRAMIQRNHLAARTKFLGFVQGAEKTRLLHESDIFVLPSYEENFGIAVTEAMAAGLPVVISDRVNICDEVRSADAGLVTLPEPDALRLAIARLLSDQGLRAEMGARGAELVGNRFAMGAIAGETVMIYQDIIQNSRASSAWRDTSSL